VSRKPEALSALRIAVVGIGIAQLILGLKQGELSGGSSGDQHDCHR
jgi:hypothetical protein